MSIRLKKVQWERGDEKSWRVVILGDIYQVMFSEFQGKWCGWLKNSAWTSYHNSVYDAKAACEQHALERILEAVEEYTIYEEAELERLLELCRLGRKVQELAEEARDSRESPFKYNEADKIVDAFDNALTIEEMGLETAETAEQINALFAEIDAREMPLPKPPKEAAT